MQLGRQRCGRLGADIDPQQALPGRQPQRAITEVLSQLRRALELAGIKPPQRRRRAHLHQALLRLWISPR